MWITVRRAIRVCRNTSSAEKIMKILPRALAVAPKSWPWPETPSVTVEKCKMPRKPSPRKRRDTGFMIIAPRQWPKTGRTPPQVCTSLTIQLAAELEQLLSAARSRADVLDVLQFDPNVFHLSAARSRADVLDVLQFDPNVFHQVGVGLVGLENRHGGRQALLGVGEGLEHEVHSADGLERARHGE